MLTIQKVLAVLKTIVIPGEKTDIVTCGFVRDIQVQDDSVRFQLLAVNQQAFIEQEARRKLVGLPNCRQVHIETPSLNRTSATASVPTLNGLAEVKHIIAVSSCKGGVGKSTIAAHLAGAFQMMGAKTGLVDVDLHGPSLPALFQIPKVTLLPDDQNRIKPVDHHGLKLMSFGFLLGDAPAVMRGPIVTRYVQQLLLNTAWGKLDYLFIDMPPGTGDVHLTVTQSVKLSGAVIVTTPHSLALTDVARGILMFEKVNVPILGIIENMACFVAPESGVRHNLFGPSGAGKMNERFGIPTLAEIPILPEFSQSLPPFGRHADIQNATRAIKEKLNQSDATQQTPEIHFDEIAIYLTWPNGKIWQVNNRILRLNSQDAYSVDEMTGKRLIRERDIRTDLMPQSVTPLGNYAINVAWNDGHSAGIYPYKLIETLADQRDLSKNQSG